MPVPEAAETTATVNPIIKRDPQRAHRRASQAARRSARGQQRGIFTRNASAVHGPGGTGRARTGVEIHHQASTAAAE